MLATGVLVFAFLNLVQTSTLSVVTDDETENLTSPNLDTLDSNNVDVFRQLLNQETIIRMTLVKNVHALMKDMLTLQGKLTVAENMISTIQTSTDHEISELKKEVDILQTENSFLKNHSAFCKNDLEKLKENLDNVTKRVTDVKVEVRYLTITLFDINDRYREMEKLVQYFNVSTENIKSEIANNEHKQSAALLELKTQHMKTIENIHNTTRALKADINQFQMDHLKLSASVSSLELFRNNQTGITCDPKQEVAFTAAVTTLSTTWNSGTLMFDVVITNVGNGYNPRSGVFTSPGKGTYVFYVSALEYLQQYLGLEIVLNNVPKVRLIGESAAAYQTGTNMVVLNLQKGDSVWVRHHHGKGYYSHSIPVTTFSGFLLPS
ncbi:multimerin-2-like [Crassostrea angulata]|uniref:multimerin-2-like n=1 Tax=Magallana angulata TaxID=2784310 RepID=UPI0022B0F249|nr:multimerin-2-like [Crassostrea angulata]